MVLFVNYSKGVLADSDLFIIAIIALIPAIAVALIVLGVFRYIEASSN
jgi:hypothetical protein